MVVSVAAQDYWAPEEVRASPSVSALQMPGGVYAIPVTADSLAIVTSTAVIPRCSAIGLIYPDSTSMGADSLFIDVSRNGTTFVPWRLTSGGQMFIINNLSGGFVSLSHVGFLAAPGYVRVRTSVGDTCRATKTFYFTYRQGG